MVLNCLCSVRFYSSAASQLVRWTSRFKEMNVSEAETSAGLIISHVLGKKTFNQLSTEETSTNLTPAQDRTIDQLCAERLSNVPVQYIIKEWDFRGVTLKMQPPVFIPRPETEMLVDLVVKDISELVSERRSTTRMLEVGCGSGAISLAVMRGMGNSPNLHLTAIDVDRKAVELTRENRDLLRLKFPNFEVEHRDICSFRPEPGIMFDAIFSNPPYISTEQLADLEPEVSRYESMAALHGGEDGLGVVRNIIAAASTLLRARGWIWLEVDEQHPEIVAGILPANFRLDRTVDDLFDRKRFVKLVKTS